ncbi:MAG: flagellar biosynthetic protein FliO [Deltaproteobacteria bacterium]|nr:flagellar biosynthetic protein FliO [Deltaproteobacteria bacterium]
MIFKSKVKRLMKNSTMTLWLIAVMVLFMTPMLKAQSTPGTSGGIIAQVDLVTPAAEPPANQASGPSGSGSSSSGAAATQAPPPAASLPGQAPSSVLNFPDSIGIIKTIGAFILVLALLLICLKVIGWLGRGRTSFKSGRAFNLRGTMALDARRYLAAVEVDGHLLVIGVTPDRITALSDWLMEDDPNAFESKVSARRSKSQPSLSAPELAAVSVQPDETQSFSGPSFQSPPPAVKPPRAKAPQPNLAKAPAGRPGSVAPAPESISGPGISRADFALTLDDEPFSGPQTNDDFIKLDLDND